MTHVNKCIYTKSHFLILWPGVQDQPRLPGGFDIPTANNSTNVMGNGSNKINKEIRVQIVLIQNLAIVMVFVTWQSAFWLHLHT
jgi:hypothetical protein